jgi:hypothetical protein
MFKSYVLRIFLALSLYTTTTFCSPFFDFSQIKFVSALSQGIGKTINFVQKNKAIGFVVACSGALLLKADYSKYKSYCNQYLLLAVRENNINKARNLIRAGADVNARDNEGLTPLHIAATNLSTEMVNMLITAGADCNALTPSYNRETPLDKTLTINISRTANGYPANLDVVDNLIAHTNVNIADPILHDTPLHRIVKTATSMQESMPEGGYALCAQYARKLINAGASLTALNKGLFSCTSRTPLQEAIIQLGTQNPLTKLLLKAPQDQVRSTMARALHSRLGESSPASLISPDLMHDICQLAS